ncbi:MAG: hypothetical protein E7106_08300 [Prevotella sp.]|jgi:hypothetical protein|nr:hypothetical protein [Prevotella sp.]
MRSKKLFILVCFLLGCTVSSEIQAKKDVESLIYSIQCGGSGTQGYYIVEVTTYAKKVSQINQDLVCRCAVHGVLFKGFPGSNGCMSQRPLAGSALVEQQHQEFFGPFFQDGGGYVSYASMVDGSLKTQKEGKKFKVKATVSVAKDQLRKDMEKAGVIKGLNSGF